MGLQDRDYFWEDRKRREEKFKRDTYYRPKEFRRKKGQEPTNGWRRPPIKNKLESIFFFLLGSIITLSLTMVLMHLKPHWVSGPYYLAGQALELLGLK